MRVVRHVYSFCRTQAYLERFTELEKEVNRREKELIEKREQVSLLAFSLKSSKSSAS